jgi:hypothetical protein
MASPDSPTNGNERRDQDYFLAKEGIVELALLLPDWEAAALEEAAHRRGLTAGQLIRRLIQDYFGKFVQPRQPGPGRVNTDAEFRCEILGMPPPPEKPPEDNANAC